MPEAFPGVTLSFLPPDMITQILNFGLPAPVDIQIEGADLEGNRQVANQLLTELRQVAGGHCWTAARPYGHSRSNGHSGQRGWRATQMRRPWRIKSTWIS